MMNLVVESPVLREIVAEQNAVLLHAAIGLVLEARFGVVPEDIENALVLVNSIDRLIRLNCRAATCDDLTAFRTTLAAGDAE
jgi:hypothetical protein